MYRFELVDLLRRRTGRRKVKSAASTLDGSLVVQTEKLNVEVSRGGGHGHTMDTMYIKLLFFFFFFFSLVHLLQDFHVILRDEASFALQFSFQPAGLSGRSHCGKHRADLTH